MPSLVKIKISGSKSITNRVLILASLSNYKTIIKNAGLCGDTKYMIKNLKKLGVRIQQQGNTIIIKGKTLQSQNLKNPINKPVNLYTGNAGTTTRFLTAYATLTGNTIKIDGDKRMRKRPIEELTQALNNLGAKISTNKNFLPITIHSKKLTGGKIILRGDISSQFLSALLMIAPFAKENTTISIEQKLCSRPYIEMTLNLLKQFGIKIVNKNFKQFIIQGNQKIKPPKIYQIESDASSASYIGAFAALHPDKLILLKNIHIKSLQGDIKFVDYFKKIGCKIIDKKEGTLIHGRKNLKTLGEIDMNLTPDLVMTFAVLAMFTKGKTKIKNIANLRIKETDRLQALKNEIKKFGIEVKTGKDFIEIEGNPVKLWEFTNSKKESNNQVIPIETYNDHRIAMSFGIIQDIFPFIKIQNPNCVSKSYTTFWSDLKKLTK